MHTARHLLVLILATAASTAATAAEWSLREGENRSALVFGTPGTDRDSFRLECSNATLTLSTWAGSPPRGVSEGTFPTQIRVLFGNREFEFAATGRVTGPDGLSRVDARIADPGAFLTSLGGVSRLTTVIYAGRRMAVTPAAAQLAGFRRVCGF